jgi:hypothetical protein
MKKVAVVQYLQRSDWIAFRDENKSGKINKNSKEQREKILGWSFQDVKVKMSGKSCKMFWENSWKIKSELKLNFKVEP